MDLPDLQKLRAFFLPGFFLSLLFFATLPVSAQNGLYSVSGEISISKRHPVTVEIINKYEYDNNLASVYAVIIPGDEKSDTGKPLSFKIDNIPAGSYIVKVYQDLNGNGKYDFALIGGEPLGTYKKPGFTLGRPSFKKLAFELKADLSGIKIEL